MRQKLKDNKPELLWDEHRPEIQWYRKHRLAVVWCVCTAPKYHRVNQFLCPVLKDVCHVTDRNNIWNIHI